MIYDEEDEVVEEFFKSFFNRYHNNLEKPMKGSDFIFDYVHLFYYKLKKEKMKLLKKAAGIIIKCKILLYF